ncbi:MAG: RNA polymerase sigma factor [Arenicella sp.]
MNDDIELIKSIAKKDKLAFERLYHQYFRRIYSFSLRIVKQPSIADEVVNDTLYAIWQNAGSFQSKSKASTWILGIAYRQSLKNLQKHSKHQKNSVELDDLENQTDTDKALNPEQATAYDEFAQNVQTGITRLSESHRAVVQLTAMGMAYDEIAEIIDCPVNTVKTRMFHARKQLKRYLIKNNFINEQTKGFTESC